MKFYLVFFLLIVLQGCGFQKVDRSIYNNFDVSEISMSGEKRINYKLKNELIFSSTKNNQNLLKIDISTTKDKKVKDKNIKNEITNYTISVTARVKATLLNTKSDFSFTVSTSEDYKVEEKYLNTINNEKKTMDTLIINLADNILEELRARLSDL